ncbi:MAG: hypothetical protein JWO31_3206 [Phycisphaerales bacterium]|nr:hypothetical protein [Phycisphaerales bacterium]
MSYGMALHHSRSDSAPAAPARRSARRVARPCRSAGPVGRAAAAAVERLEPRRLAAWSYSGFADAPGDGAAQSDPDGVSVTASGGGYVAQGHAFAEIADASAVGSGTGSAHGYAGGSDPVSGQYANAVAAASDPGGDASANAGVSGTGYNAAGSLAGVGNGSASAGDGPAGFQASVAFSSALGSGLGTAGSVITSTTLAATASFEGGPSGSGGGTANGHATGFGAAVDVSVGGQATASTGTATYTTGGTEASELVTSTATGTLPTGGTFYNGDSANTPHTAVSTTVANYAPSLLNPVNDAGVLASSDSAAKTVSAAVDASNTDSSSVHVTAAASLDSSVSSLPVSVNLAADLQTNATDPNGDPPPAQQHADAGGTAGSDADTNGSSGADAWVDVQNGGGGTVSVQESGAPGSAAHDAYGSVSASSDVLGGTGASGSLGFALGGVAGDTDFTLAGAASQPAAGFYGSAANGEAFANPYTGGSGSIADGHVSTSAGGYADDGLASAAIASDTSGVARTAVVTGSTSTTELGSATAYAGISEDSGRLYVSPNLSAGSTDAGLVGGPASGSSDAASGLTVSVGATDFAVAATATAEGLTGTAHALASGNTDVYTVGGAAAAPGGGVTFQVGELSLSAAGGGSGGASLNIKIIVGGGPDIEAWAAVDPSGTLYAGGYWSTSDFAQDPVTNAWELQSLTITSAYTPVSGDQVRFRITPTASVDNGGGSRRDAEVAFSISA